MNLLSVFLVLFYAIFCGLCESYKILAIFPMPAHSHYTVQSKILKELARRGHELTVINPFPQKTPIENFKDVSVESLIDIINERKKNLLGLEGESIFWNVRVMAHFGCILTEETLKHENVQKIVHSNETYDLVVVAQFLNEGLMGIAHHFKAPIILISSFPLFPWASFLYSYPSSSAYVPNSLTAFTGRMNFWERVQNSFHDLTALLYHQWIVLPKHRELVKKYIPGEPDLYNFVDKPSLILINSHWSVYDATIYPSNVFEIGGIHIETPKELPEDLKKFLDESKNGVIIFSMGSNLKSSNFPLHIRAELLNTFSKLKQNVLWKWETEEMDGKPQNVKLMKWLPQSDILAHPNVRVFITHGGLLSTMESVYHGVPVVGIPVFADQKMNMATAESYGYGITVPLQELTQEKLYSALNDILSNPKYTKNVKKRSKIMKDEPMKPLDKAVYWVEYVARHNGASHLRYTGADLTWYQRYLLDVATFFIFVIFAVLLILFIVVKKALNIAKPSVPKSKKSD